MNKTEKKRKEAQRLHIKNILSEAEVIYRYLISVDPQDCDIANLGALLRKQGRMKEAMNLYNEWVGKKSSSKEVYLNAINCAIECRILDKAQIWLEQGLKVHRENRELGESVCKDTHSKESTSMG